MGLPYNEPDEPPQGTHITESDENKKHAGRERTERLERRIAGCRAGREGLNCRGVGSPVRFPALRQPPLKADGDGRGPRNFVLFLFVAAARAHLSSRSVQQLSAQGPQGDYRWICPTSAIFVLIVHGTNAYCYECK
ncbi:unnamed protein product, partial [Nesidiocoris tenuis]